MFRVCGRKRGFKRATRTYASPSAPNQINLRGRTAVVTGGAQGIGLAITERFLASGAKVCIWDIDESLLTAVAKKLGPDVKTAVVDVSKLASVTAGVKTALQGFGKIDILVNNAGIAGPNAPTWEYPVDKWQQVMDICLNGVFYCCREVVPQMINNDYGRIINVASVAGKEGNPNASAYSTAKAGVIALTKSLGKELAKNNIAVNCITPAASPTRIFDQMSKEHIAFMLSKIPRNRFVQTDEIAAMVAWLVSEDNSFTTAGVFDISGGRATY